MIKEACTTRELAQILGIAPKNIIARARREGWESKPRIGRGGGVEWLVNNKMPAVTRAEIVAAEAANAPPPTFAVCASDIVIPDWSFEMGKARARLVMEWRAFVARAAKKGTPKMQASESFIVALNAGLLIPESVIKAVGAYSLKSIYRWDKQLRENGNNLEALADRRGKWLQGGAEGLGQMGEEAESMLLALYLNPNKYSLAYAYRRMKDLLTVKGLPVPSYTSARRFMDRYTKAHYDIVVLRREGEKAYNDMVGPYVSRDDSVLNVGDVLVADGHRMNSMVINPSTGKPCRMTLIGWQDWASRVFVAFEIMLNENTQAIASSLHRAIMNLGKMPKAVYIDNGKAFKNKFFNEKADLGEYDGLYMRLGIDPKYSAPYEARTKIIERWWGDFDRQCAVAMESYVGNCIHNKPAHLHRNEKWHQDRRESLGQNYIPTVDEVAHIVAEYAKWKAQQPHPTRPYTTPWEMFAAARGEGFNEAEQADIARHFLYRKSVNPSRCRFELYGLEYESEVLNVLHGLNKPIMAHYSYSDLSEIYLYDDGRYLGKAHPVTTVNPLAAKFGTELDVQRVKGKLKEFSVLRRDTRKLAAQLDEGQAEVVLGLSHMRPAAERRTPLVLIQGSGKSVEETPAAPMLTEAEAAELAALSERLKALSDAAPAYELPQYFSSQAEKYEKLFLLSVCEGIALTEADTAFMRDYEQTDTYHASVRRYDQLRGLYNTINAKEATA